MDTLEIIENASEDTVAGAIERLVGAALAASPAPVAIAVPGGSTPFPIIERLARAPLDWHRVTVWPTDDRVVGEDHPASNTGRIRALLAPAGAEVITLTVMEQVPRFALVWLGMGEDGHVASLFPNADPRADDSEAVRRVTPDPLPPDAPFDRITLTMPALLASDRLAFVIRGTAKRRVFDDAAAGRSDTPAARLLKAASQPVSLYCLS